MDDYGYINARVRARWPLLLGAKDYEELIRAESPDAMLRALGETPLRRDVAPGSSGLAGVLGAVRAHLTRSVREVLSFSSGEPRRIYETVLARWDTANLITLLRAKVRGASREEALLDTVPLGTLTPERLSLLAREESPSELLDRLASWGLAIPAQITREITREIRAGNLSRAEYLLWVQTFTWARARLNPRRWDHRLVLDFLEVMVDIRNIVAAMLLAKYGIAPKGRVEPLPGGTLRGGTLRKLLEAKSYREVVEALGGTRYQKLLAGVGPGAAERALESYLLTMAIREARAGDPLGPGVALGYFFAKETEAANLRTVAVGLHLGASPKEIRGSLLLVSLSS